MKHDNGFDGCVLSLCIILVPLMTLFLGGCLASRRWQNEAIQTGHGYYHPVTGAFEWKEKEENE